jgi:phospholipid N-methyltransferase
MSASYSPDDNKLRLYASSRLDAETYQRVRAAGFIWAPKQGLFVSPAWSPEREDLLIELCGEIEDEDKSLVDRAEERAERFEDYSDKRRADADSAHKAVAAIADNIPLGQPILVGHHSERHARKDAERIENGMRKAVKMWETSQYWTSRASGAIRHAKYKERPDVRARRIKGLESEVRKLDRADKEIAERFKAWALVDKPEAWKPNDKGELPTREQRAYYIAGRTDSGYVARTGDDKNPRWWSPFDVLRPEAERYKDCPSMTVDEVLEAMHRASERAGARRDRWRAHYQNRLAYERAMLADAGGTVTDRTGPEVGGGCLCWASPRNGWSYIQKVNKVSVTVLDNWGNSGGNFTRNIPFDKLGGVMTKAQVDEARAEGRLIESADKTGFFVGAPRCRWHDEQLPCGKCKSETPSRESADSSAFDAMKAQLKQGVQVVTANQLFPTPADLADRMVDEADIQPDNEILEPSAGTGAIIDAIRRRLNHGAAITAVEINPQLAHRLRFVDCLGAGRVRDVDFLTCNGDLGTFDRILMNPPFRNGEDIKHITHAMHMLKPGGRLVAICADGPRQNETLKPMASTWEELPADTFKDQGTGVRAVLLTIDREC